MQGVIDRAEHDFRGHNIRSRLQDFNSEKMQSVKQLQREEMRLNRRKGREVTKPKAGNLYTQTSSPSSAGKGNASVVSASALLGGEEDEDSHDDSSDSEAGAGSGGGEDSDGSAAASAAVTLRRKEARAQKEAMSRMKKAEKRGGRVTKTTDGKPQAMMGQRKVYGTTAAAVGAGGYAKGKEKRVQRRFKVSVLTFCLSSFFFISLVLFLFLIPH